MNLNRIFRDFKLSQTRSRIRLLNILSDSDHAMSEKEIEDLMGGSCNRTTIYRNLSSLVEKKVLHRILSGEAVRYKLIYDNSDRYREHIHFQCRECSTTFCLEGIPIQEYSLPEGFKMIENQFLILGICNNCHHEPGKNI
jgi:Fe2+ or Zn2+ uptake regulation protein